ncbi:MAG: ribosome maturation factor RimP [Gammaproteobacteria bacterium]|nr:ribosome maturation factor RimP [Gammaproteobacteria bacterium]
MRRASAPVWDCVESVVSGMGYQFVGAQYGRGSSGALLRVYIDAEPGIDVEDCAKVSQQLSAVLDVEDPIREAYVLEVSSPGLDRPLFRECDFVAHSGALVRVRLHRSVDGQRNVKGRLRASPDSRVLIEAEDQLWELDYADIDEARLVPEYS